MGGSISSNLHAIFFEVDDLITRGGGKNSMEVNMGDISWGSKVEGCFLVKESKFSGGRNLIDLYGTQVNSKCSDEGNDKILDNEKYFSSCFLVPKNLKVKDNDGTDISDKCKLVYKTELKCEGDDTEETVEESFTNLKKNDNNNNNIQCIFIAAIILTLFIIIKRKNF
tara:strand:+ start:13 stop:516 length:504 start_codon:yes stop_codon:yes gene_type:complete